MLLPWGPGCAALGPLKTRDTYKIPKIKEQSLVPLGSGGRGGYGFCSKGLFWTWSPGQPQISLLYTGLIPSFPGNLANFSGCRYLIQCLVPLLLTIWGSLEFSLPPRPLPSPSMFLLGICSLLESLCGRKRDVDWDWQWIKFRASWGQGKSAKRGEWYWGRARCDGVRMDTRFGWKGRGEEPEGRPRMPRSAFNFLLSLHFPKHVQWNSGWVSC